MTLNELQASIAAKLDEIAAIEAKAGEESRDLNAEETQAIEDTTANVQALIEERDELERRVKARERAADLRKRFEDGAAPKKASVTSTREAIEDDPKRGWNHLGDFAAAVFNAEKGGAFTDPRLHIGAAATGMSFGDGASAGYLVPPEFSAAIWDGLNDGDVGLLGRTDTYTVTGESLTFNANAETSRATGSRYGGVRGYWRAEADQLTSSTPKLRQVKLEPQELDVLVYATDKLLSNASAAERFLRQASTEEIRFLVEDAIVNGDGVGKPSGLLNSGSLVTVTRDTSNKFKQTDVAAMWARLHARMMPNAVWLINQEVLPELLLMVTTVRNDADNDSVGGFNANLFNASAFTLMGRPIIITEYNAALGTTGDVILTDLGAYATGTRGGVDSAMSMHLRFDYRETAFRFGFEVDGQSWLQQALTPYKGSATQSNVIVLS